MAGEHVRHAEWRNESIQYPFADAATLTNGTDFIGEGIFLDASLYPIGAGPRMYLSRVIVTSEQVQLVIGDERVAARASTTFSPVEPPDELPLLDPFGRPAGLIVSEASRLATFQSWSLGEHVFTPVQTEFAARVCLPTPELGVRGFILDDGSVFTDDVWFVGEDGVVLSTEEITVPAAGYSNTVEVQQVLRVDIVGDPLFRRRLCEGVFVTPRLLKTLTFRHGCEKVVCGPDTAGDLKISVTGKDREDTVLRIRAVPQGLIVEAVGERLETLR